MKAILEEKEYPKNTIGYHYQNARALFCLGTHSTALKFLQEKADKSQKGFDEHVVAHETQVVFMIMEMVKKDLNNETPKVET